MSCPPLVTAPGNSFCAEFTSSVSLLVTYVPGCGITWTFWFVESIATWDSVFKVWFLLSMISKGDASKGFAVLPRLSLTTFLFVCPLEFWARGDLWLFLFACYSLKVIITGWRPLREKLIGPRLSRVLVWDSSVSVKWLFGVITDSCLFSMSLSRSVKASIAFATESVYTISYL